MLESGMALVWNAGFTPMASTTVNYTIDNLNYRHEFANNGNYLGFRPAYYFKPMNTLGQKAITSSLAK